MRRLVFVTQAIDPADPNLGATVPMVAALARRLDEVAVICDRAVAGALPENCRVRTFGAPSRAERARRYLAALRAELEPRPLGVLAHMVPLYAVVAAPLVRPRGIPLALWYTHWKSHLPLRAAAALCTRLLTAEERSFPLRSGKLRAIGHAIDVSGLACLEPRGEGPFVVAALGRYSPAKRLDELAEGVRIARGRGLDARLALHGTTGTAEEEACKRSLEARLAGEEWASVGGPVPRTELSSALAGADVVAANFTSADKIVFEAGASCRPVLASYPGFERLFAGIEPPLAFERGRPESLAERLLALAALPAGERAAIGRELRGRVEREHSVDSWADAVVETLSS
ncbi:MAG TPA: glycosyltransferase [Gaiellaceae bacterium]|nr:glycosyltransferase [Gaiellaceae bacterium]